MSRRVTLLASLLLVSILAACGSPAITGVVSVEIVGGDREIAVTATELLTASVTAASGIAESVSWSSSDEAVATVDSDGVVHAVGLGTTTVTATSTADATKSDSAVVTVVKPTVADGAFMATAVTPPGGIPLSGAALSLLSAQTAPPPVARAAVTELEWPFFVGPLSPIADDGVMIVKFPASSDLTADVLTTADKLYWQIDDMVDCSLTASSPSVAVTPVAFEFISVPGVMLFTFEGALPAVVSNFPIDLITPPTAEQLADLVLYTWVYAAGDVSVVSTGAGCDFGSSALEIDVDLSQGWNQLEWQLDVDEVTTDITGLHLVNSDGTDIYVAVMGSL